jgi:cell division protein ZipA
MPQLRWTLLGLGVLFILVLIWYERRRERQRFTEQTPAQREPDAESIRESAFREPALRLPEMRAHEPGPPHELPVVEIEEDSLNARRPQAGESVPEPLTVSLPVMDSGPVVRGRTIEPTVSEIAVKLSRADELAESVGQLAVDTHDTHESEPRDVASVKSADQADEEEMLDDTKSNSTADVDSIAEPIVEWPADDQRRAVAVRLVAPLPERLAGRTLRLALASEGFVLGKFSIFHKPDNNGRAVLSAASLSKPGTFDIETMDSQRYSGLSLFAVLPGPKPPLKAFEDLLATARNLNERLQGSLQDEGGGPLTPTRIASLRETLSSEAPP